eukprot:scaffold101527_cov63-Phaeocystis_antarctica.AAC.5
MTLPVRSQQRGAARREAQVRDGREVTEGQGGLRVRVAVSHSRTTLSPPPESSSAPVRSKRTHSTAEVLSGGVTGAAAGEATSGKRRSSPACTSANQRPDVSIASSGRSSRTLRWRAAPALSSAMVLGDGASVSVGSAGASVWTPGEGSDHPTTKMVQTVGL